MDRKHGDLGSTSAGNGRTLSGLSPGKQTLVEQVYGIQMRRAEDVAPVDGDVVRDAATAGVSGSGGSLPHLGRIQTAFGAAHDLSSVQAHVGGEAAAACDTIGAVAYAAGGRVAFRDQPDLHTAAHEAAHVVQQTSGVRLQAGVGEAGDAYERHADAVADQVVRGESAADLLGEHGAVGTPSVAATAVQRRVKPEDVSSEMIGKTFELSDAFTSGSTTLKHRDKVKIAAKAAKGGTDFTPGGI